MSCPTCQGAQQGRGCPTCLNASRRAVGLEPLPGFADDQPTPKPARLPARMYLLIAVAVIAITRPDLSPVIEWGRAVLPMKGIQ